MLTLLDKLYTHWHKSCSKDVNNAMTGWLIPLIKSVYVYLIIYRSGADPGFEFRGALIELNAVQSKAKTIMGWNLWKNIFLTNLGGRTPGMPVLGSAPVKSIITIPPIYWSVGICKSSWSPPFY